ncbi:uncharacterized protein LOC129779796 [Toxorhynchites rutilus septentrionalis]|uniref:uncharacterized protein LOC129779796 n=1 Tax=Toxorhynchites rutilus septentrionalis TaxID=329112 RepID=UPI002478CB54|nr:uncharacterized protein LOC129779796 [Toxorhynchites rutilus septentrionalis]
MKFVLFFGFCFGLVAVSLAASKSEVSEIIAAIDDLSGTVAKILEDAALNIQNEANKTKEKIQDSAQRIEIAEKDSVHDAYITALNNANTSLENARTTLNSVANIYSVQSKIPTDLQTRLLNDVTVLKAEVSTLKDALPLTEERADSIKALNKKTNNCNTATKDVTSTLATIITTTLSAADNKNDSFFGKLINALG